MLMINFREDPAHVRRVSRERYLAPVLIDQSGDVAGRVYGVFGPPTVYVVDRKGRLVGRSAGPHDWDSEASFKFFRALIESTEDR